MVGPWREPYFTSLVPRILPLEEFSFLLSLEDGSQIPYYTNHDPRNDITSEVTTQTVMTELYPGIG